VNNKPLRVTDLAQEFLRPIINSGDIVVDATAGTGQDTLFLCQCVGASGQVFAFDIQAVALQQTNDLLEKSGYADQVTLIHQSHADIVPALQAVAVRKHSVKAIMFNLGYLPNGDQTIITQVETTLAALNGALSLLAAGGLITICLYPGHLGGKTESQAVISWCEALKAPFVAHHFRTLNRESPPTLVIIESMR